MRQRRSYTGFGFHFTLVAVHHVLLDYHRTPIDSCVGLRLPPVVTYIVDILSTDSTARADAQYVAAQEVFISHQFCVRSV